MIQISANPQSSSKASVVIHSKYNFYRILEMIKSIPGAYLKDKEWKINVEELKGFLQKVSHISDDSTHVDLSLFETVKEVFKQRKFVLDIREKLEGFDCGIKLLEPYALLPFQHVGIEFITTIQNGIVADKVGLGKTLQGFISAEKFRRQGLTKKCLIVVTSTLKEKWQKDIKKFLGVSATIIEGGRKGDRSPAEIRKELFHKFLRDEDSYFAIISYDTLNRDYTWYIKSLFAKEPFVVIYDEIQKCKNSNTKRAKICKELAWQSNCKSRIGLSATYVETGLDNLFGVMLIIDENVFGSSYMNFATHYLTFDFMGKIKGFKNVDDAANRMKYVAIRRNKEQVKHQLKAMLPKVNESTLWVELDKEQKRLYNNILDRVVDNIKDMEKAEKISALSAMSELVYLRQVCLSTELIEPTLQFSSKINLLVEELLPEIIEDNKVMIFSFFTGFIDALERELHAKGIKCLAMHGKRPEGKVSLRQSNIDKFSASKDIQVLITSDILKEGVDVPAATYIINADILWNPAGLIQRAGRIDRLDQTHENIYIINLWSKETIEEAMYDIVYEREELAKAIIDGGATEKRHKKISVNDIKAIIKLCQRWK